MGKEKQLSFIIANYRSRNYLDKCLRSLKNNAKGFSFEIVIVNEDEDNLNIGDFGGLEIKIININKNAGFGKSVNIGSREAMGRYFCFLNPDTLLVSENINAIINEFERKGTIGIIGPKIISEKNQAQWWSAGKDATLLDLIGNNIGFQRSKKIWESKEKIPCDWVSGAALFIRRELFQKLGGFDENFFMYYEDIDLCRRAKKIGSEVIYFPAVEIRHFGGKSFPKSADGLQKKYFYNSQDYYFKKHFGRKTAFITRLLRKIFT